MCTFGNERFCRTLIAAVFALTPIVSMAWGGADRFVFAPPLPLAGLDSRINVHHLLSGPAIAVDKVDVLVSGQLVDVTAYLTHETAFNSPAPYGFTRPFPALPAGTYQVNYSTRSRFVGLGDYPEYAPPNQRYVRTLLVVAATSLVEAVEFYSPSNTHYFVTNIPDEIAALDAGVFPGWFRTGEYFLAYANTIPPDSSGATADVCRFYGKPEAGLNTHFYSSFASECAFVAQTWPSLWIYETSRAFAVAQPADEVPFQVAAGTCYLGTEPVYRLFNNKPDVNHRYTRSIATRESMLALGWISEGKGPLGVSYCAPALP